MLAGSDHFSVSLILFVIEFHVSPLFIFRIVWVIPEPQRKPQKLPCLGI